ncbi:MAG: bacteriocin, partial [Frondihabitans sp.]|nr:bacteriocin [Frondihabitans sp.]
MNHLLRDLAPFSPDTWSLIDDEAKARLSVALGARKLVDFSGPLGWEHSATSLGRVGPVEAAPAEGVIVRSRRVIPLAEVRADFTLSLEELVGAGRGAADVDFAPLDAAAQRIARLENAAVFDGLAAAGFAGIIDASPHDPVPTGDDPSRLALRTAAAIAVLKQAGIGGPYGMALDYDTWVNVHGGSDAGGAPLATHLQRLLEGPTEW